MVEAQQYVGVNQTLAAVDSIDVAEVSAQVAIEQVRPLIPPGFAIDALLGRPLRPDERDHRSPDPHHRLYRCGR
ncbi:MAG: hypothetical protein ACTSQ7_06625 [Alphaproteobacteria bacterium]